MSGASGFVGSALTSHFERHGHEIARLVRRPSRSPREIAWDPERGALDPAVLAGAGALIHLSGESIAVRWTPERKRRIWSSRVDTTRVLATAIASAEPRPRAWVSMSAAGWYGDRGDEVLTETDVPGRGWLAELAQAWEAAADPARAAGVRVVHPRMGLVLGPGGGVLEQLLRPFRLGLGGPIGDGKAWWSWIALDDVVATIERLVRDEAFEGPVNLVAPEPVRNSEFARTLGRVLRRPAILPVPPIALRLLFGEMADEALLASTRVMPARLLAAGHAFEWPALEGAIRRALDEPAPPRS